MTVIVDPLLLIVLNSFLNIRIQGNETKQCVVETCDRLPFVLSKALCLRLPCRIEHVLKITK